MAQNKIIPWAQTGTANVLSDSDYASDVASGGLYGDGVKTGQASSKQANKTWRQATAPGSGLGQFLVDNLSVDVTDADTPYTFSTRIANAVLKLAQISPFNQAWASATGGYRKYAIVSDSSGNFWVSTADQNTTVPGDSGAKWQSLFNGYATQSWADGRYLQLSTTNTQTVSGPVTFSGKTLVPNVDDFTSQEAIPAAQADGRYVRNNAGTQGGIVALDLEGNGSGRAAYLRKDGSWGILQPAGDYATNTDLNTETTNRTTADTNLQNQINNRVLKTGDTSTGTQYSSGWFWGGYNAGFGGGTATGALRWTNFGVSFGNPLGSNNAAFSGNLCVSDVIGNVNDNSSGINMRGYDYQGKLHNWFFAWNGNIQTPKGLVAFETDISSLQNQINGKQPAGNYVTASQYSDDFSTPDSRVINLAYGHRILTFTATLNDGGTTITFPVAFSGKPLSVHITPTTSGGNDPYSEPSTWTPTSIVANPWGDGGGAEFSLTIIGPR